MGTNLKTVDGASVNPNLEGLVFEEAAASKMQELLSRVVGAQRDWGLFTTTSYTRDESVALLAKLVRGYISQVDKTSCFTSTPIITKWFVRSVDWALSRHSDNRDYNYWEIEEVSEEFLAPKDASRQDHEIPNCLFVQDDEFQEDRYVCSTSIYLNYKGEAVAHCGLRNCGLKSYATIVPSRCERMGKKATFSFLPALFSSL